MPFGFGKKKPPVPDPGSEMDPPGNVEAAPGWDALDAVLAEAFPGQEPTHWATDSLIPGQDGPSGLSAYRADGDWLYVTYGLTDLFGTFQQPADAGDVRWSGFGFELTMRVPASGDIAPNWPVELLNQLGKYVYSHDANFEDGHRLNSKGPITGGDPPTRLTALAFATDPLLDAFDGPLGRIEFLRVVGITADELSRMQATSTDDVLAGLDTVQPHLTTDAAR
jgi:hypothetical protein